MQSNINKDFAAFIARIKANAGAYERRNAPDLSQTIESIAEGFEKFKEDQGSTITELRSQVSRLETRLARPGGPGSLEPSAGEVKSLKTADGRILPMLSAKQRFADLHRTDDADGFSLGGFARDAIVGSRKAASGPALVPTSLSATIIDAVRRQTVLVDAGAWTVMIDGPTNMARLTQDPTVYQHTEGATDISESDILAEPVTLNPKMLSALIPLTAEVVADSPNLDTLLTTAITAAFAAKLDALGIAALLANTSIPKSTAAQDPAEWLKVLAAVGSALGLNQGLPTAHVGSPADFIARASQLTGAGGQAWLGRPPALSAMRELFTTGMPAGTALLGDFSAAFAIALRSELRIEVVRHAKPTSATHLLVAQMRADGLVLQPARLFKQLKTVA